MRMLPFMGAMISPYLHALLLHDVIYLSRGRIPYHNYYTLQLMMMDTP